MPPPCQAQGRGSTCLQEGQLAAHAHTAPHPSTVALDKPGAEALAHAPPRAYTGQGLRARCAASAARSGKAAPYPSLLMLSKMGLRKT